MTKTLGQIYFEAYDNAGPGEDTAEGAAAVARHVFAELMAKHLAEHHRLKPRTVKVDDDESAMMIGHVEPEPVWEYTSGTVSSEPANPEADWAMDAYVKACCCTSFSGCAKIIREAAELHYGQMVESLDRQMKELEQERDVAQCNATELGKSLLAMTDERDAARENANEWLRKRDEARQERDAAREECQMLRSADRSKDMSLLAARAECERLREALKIAESKCDWTLLVGPNLTPVAIAKDAQPPAAVDGEELIDAVEVGIDGWVKREYLWQCRASVLEQIRPLFDAIRRERDEANKRAEAAEAALSELREACEWHVVNVYSCWREGDRWKHQVGSGWHDSCDDAILAAYRAAKGNGG